VSRYLHAWAGTRNAWALDLPSRPRHLLIFVFLLICIGVPSSAPAQPDSTRQAILREKGLPPNHTPRKALWRALAVPGWGQYYNRQYFKIPLVYAGLAGFTSAVVYTNDQYLLYRHAALWKQSQDRVDQGLADENQYPGFSDEYQQISEQVGGEIRANVLRQQRDKYRRYRDLSVIGIGLYYALSVLDAYVSAHLLTFDVGEDLSMRVHPSPHGVTTQLRWRF